MRKFLLPIFILLFIGLSSYGYSLFRDHNQSPADTNLASPEQQDQAEQSSQTDSSQVDVIENSKENLGEDPTADSESDGDEILPPDEDAQIIVEDNNYLDISKDACRNECKDYKNSKDNKYCKKVCGLLTTDKYITETKSCDELNGLEKDYCIRDLAFNNQDLKQCSQISDTSIRKTCQDIIGQELINIRE